MKSKAEIPPTRGPSLAGSALMIQSITKPSPISVWGQLGLGEPVIENYFNKKWDIDRQLDRIITFKPKLFRLWLSADWLFDSNGNVNTANLAIYQKAIQKLNAAGIPILGMQNSFLPWMTGATPDASSWNKVPCLQATTQYNQFLNNFEAHWRKMAQLFPTITQWEPANETNISLNPIPSGPGSCGKLEFGHYERVWITIQLMERASRAIKSVNPNALVFMPPPGPTNDDLRLTGAPNSLDPSLKTIVRFIDDIYRTIESWKGNPRYYFDGISYHPYIFQDATTDSWIRPNQEIRNTVVAHGDGGAPMIISEVGNSEATSTPWHSSQELAVWMQDTIRLTQSDLPWISNLIWFRAFNDPSAASWGGAGEVNFGIMNQDYPTFSAKPAADIFCAYSGCVAGPFKFYVNGFGWGAGWQHDGYFCTYSSPQNFKDLLGLDYFQSLPWLPALDPNTKTNVGSCAPPRS